MNTISHFKKRLAMIFIAFLFALWLSLDNGAATISLWEVITDLFSDTKKSGTLTLLEIRLPRVIGAILVGAALGISGSMIQGMTKNPLADPGLLGITAGASLMLTVGYVISASISFVWLTFLSFVGALGGIVLVIGFSLFSREKLSTFTLLLVGSSVTMFLLALSQGIGLLFNVTKNVNMWTSGGLSAITWQQIALIMPILLVALGIGMVFSKEITLLSLDENLAIALGQKVGRTKLVLMVLIAVLTGLAVSLAGNMAFVGLMIPHLVRLLVGYDYKRIIPVSILVGGLFMMIADLLSRTLNRPYEIPLVAIVSIIGLPFFLIIVRRQKGGAL
jgi:iron complex transport system permease protein